MIARWDKTASAGEVPGQKYEAVEWAFDPPGVDPYFRWARHTHWRSYTQLCAPTRVGNGLDEIRVIARAPGPEALAAVLARDSHPLTVPKAYRLAVNDRGEHALHFSAKMPMKEADWLMANPYGLSLKLALPQRDAESVADASSEGQFGRSRDPTTLQAGNVVEDEVAGLKAPSAPGAQAGLLALIDHGCPFLNTRFEDDAKGTRIVALWDQGASPDRVPPQKGWPWKAPQLFDHGRELGPDALNAITQTARGSRRLDEYAVYRGIDHLIDYDDPRRRVRDFTHGGHLLDILGGSTDPASGAQGDKASKAPLVFVQLPLPAAMDSTGGSLAPHLLDGVRYAMSLCELAAPLVISISYGGQAGPHDGSSIIETAFEELLSLRPVGFAIVLAAGNARQARAHARRVVGINRSALLRCQLAAGDTTDSFIEIWYQHPVADPGIEIRARTPGGLWSPWVGPQDGGHEVLLRDDSGGQNVVALLRHDRRVPNGSRAMALLALAPTARRAGDTHAVAEAGEWQIEVQLVPRVGTGKDSERRTGIQGDTPAAAADTVLLDAWIERDDPSRGSSAFPPFFIDQLAGDPLHSLSSIATGRLVLRAGGFNLGSGRMTAYSALSDHDWQLPEVLAVCEQDEESPSIQAAATRSGETMRMNGTSVAAPVLARRLFNAMVDEGPTKDAVALRAMAIRLATDGSDPCLTLPQRDD